MKEFLRPLYPKERFGHVLNVDLRGLFETITTLHEGRKYRLSRTVKRLSDQLESRDLDIFNLVTSSADLVEVFTKRRPETHKLINRIFKSENLMIPPKEMTELEGDE